MQYKLRANSFVSADCLELLAFIAKGNYSSIKSVSAIMDKNSIGGIELPVYTYGHLLLLLKYFIL